jgi:hypothetical protein
MSIVCFPEGLAEAYSIGIEAMMLSASNQPDDSPSQQWQAFLAHPTVKTLSSGVSPTTYLCRKTLHEMHTGCLAHQLTSIVWERLDKHPEIDYAEKRALQELMASPFHEWYKTWRPVVDTWDTQLAALEDQYGHIGAMQDLDYALDAPAVIAQTAAL